VPLDHRGRTPGTLDLAVAVADNAAAPRGVLLLLTGGPGQPGVPFVAKLAPQLAPVLDEYRLVMLDQRGTGANALVCPGLQRIMGGGDLTPPTPRAVRACGHAVGGDRRFYRTDDTVADLDLLRGALGAGRWTLDGVSYGTFVAERYALAHPERVARLVLDSVVPHDAVDPFLLDALRATGRVLRSACAASGCHTDPAADLARVVRRYALGPDLLDALTIYGIVDPAYGGVAQLLHAARRGHLAGVRNLIRSARAADTATPQELSQGLHASTLCADGRWAWGTSAAPMRHRGRALRRAVAGLHRRDVWPFDRATAAGNGILATCRYWPPSRPSARVGARPLPAVPTLLLGGGRDLSTPIEGLRREAARAPLHRVVIVPGAGHSVQSRADDDAGRQAVYDFLTP
jgi:pimeloyl-ACP methyl ester carboxylesterase